MVITLGFTTRSCVACLTSVALTKQCSLFAKKKPPSDALSTGVPNDSRYIRSPLGKEVLSCAKEASFRTFNGEVNQKLVKRETKSKDTNSRSAFRVMPLKKPEKSPRFLKV